MRKIITKDNSRRNQKFVVIGGIVLVIIMLFSTIGYSFMSMDRDSDGESSSFEYNGFSFVENNGYFFTKIGDYSFAIKTDPRKISGNLSDDSIKTFNKYGQLPLYYNSENDEAINEIMNNFGQIILRKNEACPGTLEEGVVVPAIECDVKKNLPLKDCAQNNVMVIGIRNESEITQDKNCVFIFGSKDNILKIADEFILKALGIL